MLTTRTLEKIEAAELWARCCEGLDLAETFGPGTRQTKPPGEWWAELNDGETVGMLWSTRWVRADNGDALVVGQGRAMLPAFRGQHRLQPGSTRIILDAVWSAFPSAQTIIAAVFSTNTVERYLQAKLKHPEIGRIPAGDKDLVIYLIETRENANVSINPTDRQD